MKKILFVCTGNICRSPTAQGILEKKLAENKLGDDYWIDSAGTHGFHAGHAPTKEAIRTAQKRGYKIDHLRARQISMTDLNDFDLIYAMAQDHFEYLSSLATPKNQHKLKLFTDYLPQIPGLTNITDIPDPYGLNEKNYKETLDLIELGVENIIKTLK